jgi:hypothetical protein
VIPTLVVVPLPFAVLGFLFIRRHLEVDIEAAYLRDCVRPLIVKQCSGEPLSLWTWEEFKLKKFRKLAEVRLLGLVVGHRLALSVRVPLFLGPAGTALLIEPLLVPPTAPVPGPTTW